MFITMADTACGALLAHSEDMTLYGPQAGVALSPCHCDPALWQDEERQTRLDWVDITCQFRTLPVVWYPEKILQILHFLLSCYLHCHLDSSERIQYLASPLLKHGFAVLLGVKSLA